MQSGGIRSREALYRKGCSQYSNLRGRTKKNKKLNIARGLQRVPRAKIEKNKISQWGWRGVPFAGALWADNSTGHV
jgi:hypothetical protein